MEANMRNKSKEIKSNSSDSQPGSQIARLLVGAFALFIVVGFFSLRAKPSGSAASFLTSPAAAATPAPLYLDKIDCFTPQPVTFTITERRSQYLDDKGNPVKTLTTTPQQTVGTVTCFGDISIPPPSPTPTTSGGTTKTTKFSSVSGLIDPPKGFMSLNWAYNVDLSGTYTIVKTHPFPCTDPNDPNKCCHLGPLAWDTASNKSGSSEYSSDYKGMKYDPNTGTATLVDAAWGLNEISSTNNYNQCGQDVADDMNLNLPVCTGAALGKCAISMAFSISPIIKGTPISRSYKEKETTSGANNSATSAENIPFPPFAITGNTSTTDPDNFSFDLPGGKSATVTYVVVQDLTTTTDCNGKNAEVDNGDVSGPLLKINGKTAAKSFHNSTFNTCENTGGSKGTTKSTKYTTTYAVSNTTASSMKVVISLAVYASTDPSAESPTSGAYSLTLAFK